MVKQRDGKTVAQGKKQARSQGLHPRNPHRGRYDFAQLTKSYAPLTAYLKESPQGDRTIDFSDAAAVRCLNSALLALYYHVSHWQLPDGYLCPPIPGRADYIHNVADLLAKGAGTPESIPQGKKIKVLDIGTGASCIYPIIGSQSYGWGFIGSDIDPVSVQVAETIVGANSGLKNRVKVRLQADPARTFEGVIKKDECFDLTLCNPPFHGSLAEAQAGSQRKWRNLGRSRGKGQGKRPASAQSSGFNFGGQKAELWCPGGELAFLTRMVGESCEFSSQVCWFTSLVSKAVHIAPLQKLLANGGAQQVQVINMAQGQKVSRLIAWSFLTPAQQQEWAAQRWS